MNLHMISEFEDAGLFASHCIRTGHQDGDFPFHTHNIYEIILIKKGNATYIVDDQIFPLPKNSLVFTRPHQLHRIRLNADEPYERYNLVVSPDIFPEDLLAKIPPSVHVLHFDRNQIVTGLFEKMDYYCHTISHSAQQRVLSGLCEELIYNILIAVNELSAPKKAYRNPLTAKAVAFMEESLTSLNSVDALCRQLGISKSYLYQIFDADLHTTPKAYLTKLRLMLARKEIFLGAKATAVYSQCGFADYSVFYRAYKKQFGYSPIETQNRAFGENE